MEYAVLIDKQGLNITGNIEAICQKLIDNFFKQSPAMQEAVAMRLQALKVALYSTNFSSREKASDCHTRLVLQGINALFRSLLRPKNISSQDKVTCFTYKFMLICLNIINHV